MAWNITTTVISSIIKGPINITLVLHQCNCLFFLMAHFISYLGGKSMDGYTGIYLICIHIGAILYVLLGLWFLDNLLIKYDVSFMKRMLVLSVLAFGTHLFYYTIKEPGMSHIYSFFLISMFFYFLHGFFHFNKNRYVPLIGFILGIIVLVRPVNVIVLSFVPFVAGQFSVLELGVKRILKSVKLLLISLILFLLPILLQLVIYKIAVGKWWVYSYSEEGFNFSSPHFIDILFSYRKGLFVYTPILLLILMFSSYRLFRSNKFSVLSGLLAFIFITYVLSSWWCWWYGGSFSSRPYIEFLPYFIILFALLLNKVKHKNTLVLVSVVSFVFVLFCQIQTFQYRIGHIDWSNMTKEKYWASFGRVDRLF